MDTKTLKPETKTLQCQSYLGELKNSAFGHIGKFFWVGIGGLLTSTENSENFENSGWGQGPNWGGTDLTKNL